MSKLETRIRNFSSVLMNFRDDVEKNCEKIFLMRMKKISCSQIWKKSEGTTSREPHNFNFFFLRSYLIRRAFFLVRNIFSRKRHLSINWINSSHRIKKKSTSTSTNLMLIFLTFHWGKNIIIVIFI